jgi:hypothetical protein
MKYKTTGNREDDVNKLNKVKNLASLSVIFYIKEMCLVCKVVVIYFVFYFR